MHRTLASCILIVLISITMLFGCSGGSNDEAAPTGDAKKNLVVPIDVAGIEELMKLRGCPVMLVAMASWCAPCREELPTLQKMHERYKDRGLRIIGISLDVGGPSAMQPLVDQMGLDFPVYWGGEKVTMEYRISGIPLTYLIKNGEVVEKILGQRDESFIEKKILSLIEACEKPGE